MKRYISLIEALTYRIMPMAFISKFFIQAYIGAFFGEKETKLGLYLSIALMLLLFVVVSSKYVILLCWQPEKRAFLLGALLLPVVSAIVYATAFFLNGFSSVVFIEAIEFFPIFLTAFLTLIIITIENKPRVFFHFANYYCLGAIPLAIFYIVRFYLSENGDMRDLGSISYMGVAYLFLNLLFLASLSLLSDSGIKPDAAQRTLGWRKMQLICIMCFSVAVLFSGTRGAILCVCTLAALFSIMAVINKDKNSCLWSVMIIAPMIVFSIFAPSNSGVARILSIQQKLPRITITLEKSHSESCQNPPENTIGDGTVQDSTASKDHTYVSVENLNRYHDLVTATFPEIECPIIDGITIANEDVEQRVNSHMITKEEGDYLININTMLRSTGSYGRVYLWAMAIDGAFDKMLCGNGPMAYWLKYKTYPHNFMFEIMYDFGLLTSLIVVMIAFFSFYILFKHAKRNIMIMGVLLWSISYIPRVCLSSTVYSPEFFYVYGFVLFLAVYISLRSRQVVLAEQSLYD